MDWTLITLIFILLALWSIKGALDKIANEIANRPNPALPSFPSLSGLERQLENIFMTMGGEAKMKEERLKRQKEHYSLLVKAFVLSGKTPKQAEEEASAYLEENEYDETLGENYSDFTHYTEPSKTMSALKWAKAQFIEDRNKKKYGHLLERAREYIKGVTQIDRYDHKMQEFLQTDWNGEQWILQKLIQEKRLKAITEYNEGQNDIKHYEVLVPENQSPASDKSNYRK